MEWIEQLDPVVGSVMLVVLTAAATVTGFVPTTPMNIAAPFVAGGLFMGSVVVALGCTLGSMVNFALGRSCLRTWAQRKLHESPTLLAFEAALAERAARMVVLIRLSPVFPFAVIGYVLGATKIDLFTFTWATFVGMWPGCVLYGWVSMSMRDLATAASSSADGGGGGDGAGSNVASVLGVVLGVLGTVLVSWQAKQVFDRGACWVSERVSSVFNARPCNERTHTSTD